MEISPSPHPNLDPGAEIAPRLRAMAAEHEALITSIERHSAQLIALAAIQGVPLEQFSGVIAHNQMWIEVLRSMSLDEDQRAA